MAGGGGVARARSEPSGRSCAQAVPTPGAAAAACGSGVASDARAGHHWACWARAASPHWLAALPRRRRRSVGRGQDRPPRGPERRGCCSALEPTRRARRRWPRWLPATAHARAAASHSSRSPTGPPPVPPGRRLCVCATVIDATPLLSPRFLEKGGGGGGYPVGRPTIRTSENLILPVFEIKVRQILIRVPIQLSMYDL